MNNHKIDLTTSLCFVTRNNKFNLQLDVVEPLRFVIMARCQGNSFDNGWQDWPVKRCTIAIRIQWQMDILILKHTVHYRERRRLVNTTLLLNKEVVDNKSSSNQQYHTSLLSWYMPFILNTQHKTPSYCGIGINELVIGFETLQDPSRRTLPQEPQAPCWLARISVFVNRHLQWDDVTMFFLCHLFAIIRANERGRARW